MNSETMHQNYKIAAVLYSIKFLIATSIISLLLGFTFAIIIALFSGIDPEDPQMKTLLVGLYPISFVADFFIVQWLARKPSATHSAQAHAFALWATVVYLTACTTTGVAFSYLTDIKVGMFENILGYVIFPIFFYYVTKHFVGKQQSNASTPSVSA